MGPLNNMSLNCTGLLIRGCLSTVDTTVLHKGKVGRSPDAELQIQKNHAQEGPTISYMWIFDCCEGGTPNPYIVQGSTVLQLFLHIMSNDQVKKAGLE